MTNKRHSYEYIKQQFKKEGYKLLSKEYKNAHTKMLIICPEGHQYEVIYNDFQQGNSCPICASNQKLTYDFIKDQVEKEGYKLLSKKYKGSHSKLKVQCFEKHQYKVSYSNFQQGCRCPICYDIAKHSRSEKNCLDIVKQILPNENIIENDRTQIINPKTNQFLELDIWIPSLNKAVEFNGEYWHNNEYSIFKDNQKIKQCREKNIDLLVINYKNWIDNREEQINNLKEFIGV